jgi:hypothetical protein
MARRKISHSDEGLTRRSGTQGEEEPLATMKDHSRRWVEEEDLPYSDEGSHSQGSRSQPDEEDPYTAMKGPHSQKWVASEGDGLPFSDEGSHSHRSGLMPAKTISHTARRRGHSQRNWILSRPRKIFHTVMVFTHTRSGSQAGQDDLPFSDEKGLTRTEIGSHAGEDSPTATGSRFQSISTERDVSMQRRRSHSQG